MKKPFPQSENLNAARSRKPGSGKKSIGRTQKLSRRKAQLKKTRKRKNYCKQYVGGLSDHQTVFQLPGKIQYEAIGVLREKQSARKVMLDYDQNRTPGMRSLWVNLRLWNLRIDSICDVRTRKGWHRIITLQKPLPGIYLVAIQACSGSDRRREALNLMRQLSLRENYSDTFARSRWNLMFDRKLRQSTCKQI